MFGFHGVVKSVCLDSRSPKSALTDQRHLKPPVDQTIVKHRIGGAVGGHADADRQPCGRYVRAEPDTGDRGNRKDDCEKVVQLKHAAAGLMMALVPAPQDAMHHISVHRPGEALHAGEGDDKQEDCDDPLQHARSLTCRLQKASDTDLDPTERRADSGLWPSKFFLQPSG